MRGNRLIAEHLPGPAVGTPAIIARTTSGRFARIAALAGADLLALASAGVIAWAVWARPIHGQPLGLYTELTPLFGLFLAGYAGFGLYPGRGLGPVETLRRISFVTTFGFLILAAVSFAFKLPHLYSRATFLIAFCLSLAAVPLARLGLFYAVRRSTWWAEPVVVIGTGRRAAHAVRGIKNSRSLGYRPAAVLAADGDGSAGGLLEGVPIAGGLDQVDAMAAAGIRVALLEVDQMQTREVLDKLHQTFQHVILLREFDDLPVEGLQVRNLGSLVGIEYTNNLLRPSNQAVKRMLDVVLGTIIFLAAAPVLLVASLVVLAIDGAPIFYYQDRKGLLGRRFRVPKIRTMRRDADRRLQAHLAGNPELQKEWDERFKLRDDPRLIPFIGRFYRRFSIDELPQLWAVVVGDMSLVGPRPFPDYHLDRFTPAFRELRQRVRPGITGVWQVTVRSEGGLDDQEALDTYYIRNWSVWFDLYVLGRTLFAVLSGRGAY